MSNRSQKDILNYERERLMKKLIEAEMDGQAAAQQVSDGFGLAQLKKKSWKPVICFCNFLLELVILAL